MRMALSRGSMPFPVTDNSRTGSVTTPYVRGAATPFHSSRTTVATVPQHIQEQKRGENVQPGPEISTRRGGAYKRLFDAESQDKLRKGLCFRCDEKYGPNHRCNSKHLNLLIVAAGDD